MVGLHSYSSNDDTHSSKQSCKELAAQPAAAANLRLQGTCRIATTAAANKGCMAAAAMATPAAAASYGAT
jgi:hypothetical protein